MEPLEPPLTMGDAEVQSVGDLARRVQDNIRRAVKVREEILDHVVVTLLAEGHILVEDYPGVGKTALARALAYEPDCLVMDEPFASVDAQTRFGLEDLVLRLQADLGVTIVFVTHDIDEAVYLSDRIVVLTGSPAEVRSLIEVPLERPRAQVSTRRDPVFADLRTTLFELVREPRGDERQGG